MSRTYKSTLLSAFAALSFALLASLPISHAGIIDYPGPDPGPGGMTGWTGTTVWYGGVSESNNATEERFGAPTSITGDSLDFSPENFEANAPANSNTSVIVDSQLSFMIQALGSNVINSVQFSEAGDTTLFAFSPDQAFTSVSANFFVEVVELDGAPLVGPPVNINATMVFAPSDGDFQVGVDGAPGINELWTGTVVVDIDAELALQGLVLGVDYDFGVTKVNVTLDNTLTAASTGGASAFIRKKDFDGFTVTSNIPEPTTLAGLSLMGLLIIARRRRN